MAALFALVSVLAFAALLVFLVMMPFKGRRAVAKRNAKYAGVVLLVALVATGVLAGKEEDKKAVAAGWTSASDMKEAQVAGVTDPTAWAISREERRLKAEADAKAAAEAKAQVAAKAEADAKAAAEVKAQIAAAEQARQVKLVALSAPPGDQAAFVSAVVKSRAAYRSAETDFQRGAMRPARAAEICRALDDRSVSGWTGKVVTLDTNSEGKGVFGLEVANDVYVTTWNNAFSDIMSRSLIEPGSSMYARMATLRKGDTVKFSGSFLASDTDCVAEQSVTLDGSLREPEFTFRFRDASKIVAD